MGDKGTETDWELSDNYYDAGTERELSLEDFITDSDWKDKGLELHGDQETLFTKTVQEVHQVLFLAGEGKTVEEIAAITGLEAGYVYNIQVCAQGFREDDEIAVAHLMLG